VRRKRGSSEGSEGGRRPRLLAASLILAFSAALLSAALAFKPLAALARVDPDVLLALRSGNPVEAYVVADSTAVVKGEREWAFGRVKIVKIKLATEQDLNRLLAAAGVRSVWGSKTFRHPIPATPVTTAVEYDLSRDVKWEVHRRDGNWIGRGVTVVVIDTGIDYTHPDFYDSGNRTVVRVLASVLFVSAATGQPLVWIPGVNGTMEDLYSLDMALQSQYGETAFLDLNGHGTHVAGIIAGRGWASGGRYRGLAPGAELVVVKAFSRDGRASMDAALDALEWVYRHWADYGVKVLSLSWGASMASDGSDPISSACDEIAAQGIFVFAAAGNAGNLPTTVMVPAAAKLVYAVGAWDGYAGKIAPFSAIGTTIDFRMKPDMLAAGVMVVSCRAGLASFPSSLEVGGRYVALSGTSMAAPAAAAVCADFIEYFRYWNRRDPTRQEWERFIEYNAVRLSPVKDFISGWGIPVSP